MPQPLIKDDEPRTYFNCRKCPAYCCSIYERVTVTKRDIARLAKHFKCTDEEAEARYTTTWEDERVLKRVKDVIFEKTCMFLDQKTRGCTIYEGRPKVCREFPGRPRCAYYDLVQFERRQQDDKSVVPVVNIIFREEEVSDEGSSGGGSTNGAGDKRRA